MPNRIFTWLIRILGFSRDPPEPPYERDTNYIDTGNNPAKRCHSPVDDSEYW